jgi:uncharacterized protein YycO
MTAPWIKVPDPGFDQAYSDYISNFDHKVTVKLGYTYTSKYKEFTEWCEDRLGIRYKDWFLTSNGKGYYTLFCRDNKWMTFLALTYVDIIV